MAQAITQLRIGKDVMTMLSRLNLPAGVEHVRDVQTIARMGIMRVPAPVINGRVKCARESPTPA